MSSHAADLARRLARNAEAVCRHYLSNGRREGRYWLVGDVANTPRPQPVRPPERPRPRQGRRRQMDRRRHRRAWRSSRPHRAQPRSRPPARRPRRGARVPRPATPDPAATAGSPAGAARFARIRTPSVRHVQADRRHARRNLSAQPRHHGFARRRPAALPSALLLPPRRRQPDRDLAGADRRRHRSRRQDHRRASHLARPVRPRQGARSTRRGGPWAISSATASASASPTTSWPPAKASRPCCRCAAILPSLPMVAALSANHLAALLFPPTLRRLYVARDRDPAGDAAMASLTDRADGGRDRGARPVAQLRRFQRGSPPPRHRRPSGICAPAARPAGRRPLHGLGRRPRRDDDGARRRRFVVGRLDALRIGRGRAPAF